MKRYLLFAFLCLLTGVPVGPVADARAIEFETTQVTQADVALSPDGQTLIFTMLGHLFRLPVDGGTAEQLTFGPYYDTDHAISPDGSRVAFVSDRDGSEGNVFVLELASGKITQVTHESWAGRPTWTPDGQGIVYLSYVFEAAPRKDDFALRYHYWLGKRSAPSLVRRISLSGGEPESLSAPLRLFRSVFYMPDGRLAWTVIESGTRPRRWTTRIEVMSAQGTVSTLRSLEGFDNRVVASSTGEGFYCRRYIPLAWFITRLDEVLYLPTFAETERQIVPVSGAWSEIPRFTVSADNKTLYLGDTGRLWRIALSNGFREPIAFRARVRLEIQDPVVPPKPVISEPGSSTPPRSIVDPRLSPDGQTLVFGAAGHLWRQRLDGGPAKQVSEGSGLAVAPAFSPDGRRLAFVQKEHGKDEVSVYDLNTKQIHTLTSGDLWWSRSWSSDGERVIFIGYDEESDTNLVVAVNANDGERKILAHFTGEAERVRLSRNGNSLYFSDYESLYHLPLESNAKPEPITQLIGYMRNWLVSPDGKYVAFRRNTQIWIAPLGPESIEEKDVRQLSPEGGRSFAFAPDGSALIYAAGDRVWRHPLDSAEREAIPIRLELQHPTPPPLLVRRVRLLDFSPGGFSAETSLFVEQGRIHRIGSEREQRLPKDTVIVDAGGRFGIPGLFDMHVHGGSPAVYLAYGITSVYNTGDSLSLARQIALADRGETTREPVPRYFLSGDLFRSGSPDSGSARHLMIENESDARSYVRLWKEQGVDFIRTHPMVWPSARALVEEARRLRLPVVGHGDRLERLTKGVTLGYTGMFQVRSRFYDDVLQMLAAVGTRWTPALAQNGGNWLLLRDEPERLADEKFRAFTGEWAIRRGFWHFEDVSDSALRGVWIELLAGVRAAHQRGVRLLAGSGCTGPGTEVFCGTSLHWELEYLVQAGLAPVEVLRIATQEAAAAVGADDDLGTLEVGKLADIVLLDANPLEDIKNTQTIWRVIKGGWVFDPEQLRPAASTSSAPD